MGQTFESLYLSRPGTGCGRAAFQPSLLPVGEEGSSGSTEAAVLQQAADPEEVSGGVEAGHHGDVPQNWTGAARGVAAVGGGARSVVGRSDTGCFEGEEQRRRGVR